MASKLQQVSKYNLKWAAEANPVLIEQEMIWRGGRWRKKDETMAGEGMEFHFKALMKLLWPWITWHSWTELQVKCYLNYRIIGQIGCASSGKSFVAAACVLTDYYCFPHSTTVLVSSTTRDSLEMRVWGEIKKLHKSAKQLHDFLPGYLIEGKQRIVSDPKTEASEGRDFRNGLVGVACFPSGSMVDTPAGPMKIESLSIGDQVLNAVGIGIISSVFTRVSSTLVRVHLSDGRNIDCTEDHPFLTNRGWIRAFDLQTYDMVYSAHETMQIMQKANRIRVSKPSVLLDSVQRFSSRKAMQGVRKVVSTSEQTFKLEESSVDRKILQQAVLGDMGKQAQGIHQERNEEVLQLRQDHGFGSLQADVLLGGVPGEAGDYAVPSVWKGIHINTGITKETKESFLRYILQEESEWKEECEKACLPYPGRDGGVEDVSGFNSSLSRSYRNEMQGREQALVSVRHSVSGDKTSGGDRRWNSSYAFQGTEGYSKDRSAEPTWVDRVEILEPSGDPRFEQGQNGYTVHNIEVTGHPSYSVNGVVVHNCKRGQAFQGMEEYVGIKNKHLRMIADELQFLPRQFVDAISNMNKNKDFKCVGSGNPKDTTDALGVLCEPAIHLGGWDGGIDQTPKTKTWEIRFPQGICIQLPGSDSPNLDGRLGIPLITQEHIDADIKFYGKDSIQYSMMDEGRMPRGQGTRRVITRQLCLKHGAMEEPLWLNSTRTRIGALDAAYRGVGGDRCVFMELAFGMNSERKLILALVDTMVIPIKDSPIETPEDQIALQVKDQCERRWIKPDNFGFDSTGRGSLMAAFARLWSPHVVPVEFGGSPTERPVSNGLDVVCKDYYSKFVTELWYSVRLVIEGDQFRGMTDDVMAEGCSREWTIVGANKIEVEPKDKTKLKIGRSPDLFDTLVTGVEVARRRGFKIERVINPIHHNRSQRWKEDLRDRAKALWSNHSLNYKA